MEDELLNNCVLGFVVQQIQKLDNGYYCKELQKLNAFDIITLTHDINDFLTQTYITQQRRQTGEELGAQEQTLQ